ncbi:MAG: META domain-containing protein [Chloroflexota bacterium]
MTTRPILALAAIACITAAACSSAGPGAASPSAPTNLTDPAALDGRVFLSTKVDGPALVAGSVIRLAFAGGNISVQAGCNSMSGTYRIDGDRLVVGALATTEMACESALMEQDRWVANLLSAATISLSGDSLTLALSGVRLTLLDREVADPDRPLIGTHWLLDGIVAGEAVSSVPVGVQASLSFSDRRVDVMAGCNAGGGAVEISASELDFGAIALTRKGCEPDVMAVEQAVSAALVGKVSYKIEADVLTIDAEGQGLILRAAP